MNIPLSHVEQIAALAERRREAAARVEHFQTVVAVSVYFQENGTSSEPVPEAWLPELVERLQLKAAEALAEIDAQLRALGVEPDA